MEDLLKKAFEQANYATTLANQKRVLLEEFNQNSILFYNGATFHADKTLISYIKSLIDLGQSDAVLIDNNDLPIDILNLEDFLEKVINKHVTAINEYQTKYTKLKNSRTIESLLDL